MIETRRANGIFTILLLLVVAVSFGHGFVLANQSPVARSAAATTKTITATTQPPKEKILLGSSPTALLASSGVSSTGDDATIIAPDFRLAGIFLTGGLLLDQLPFLKFTLGPIITLLGVLFLVQTFRLKFVCDSTAFELQNTSKESGENVLVGGANRWTYSSFVNYEFFPKGWIDQPQGPILVYFKETQTPSSTWNDGPGKSANSEEALAKGAKPGQVHFFPALCNCQQLRAEWERRGCAKL